MKVRALLKKYRLFFVGFIMGVVCLFSLGLYKVKKDAGKPLMAPRIFGDIRISIDQYSNDKNDRLFEDVYRSLVIEKSNNPFLGISQNYDGQTNTLFLFNSVGETIFTMDVSDASNSWVNARYGSFTENMTYEDIDCDGVFDVIIIFGKASNGVSTQIFIDDTWHNTDNYDVKFNRASIGKLNYEFKAGEGWVLRNSDQVFQ